MDEQAPQPPKVKRFTDAPWLKDDREINRGPQRDREFQSQRYRFNSAPMINDRAKEPNNGNTNRRQYFQRDNYNRFDSGRENIRWPNRPMTNYFNNRRDMEQQYKLPGLMRQQIQFRPDQGTNITQHFDVDAPCGFCSPNIKSHTIGQCPKRRSPKTYYYSATETPRSTISRQSQ